MRVEAMEVVHHGLGRHLLPDCVLRNGRHHQLQRLRIGLQMEGPLLVILVLWDVVRLLRKVIANSG